ncbi:hypothetical protein [Natronincola peptidivorans]|uniref:hypothetical protein n=1 Tax=Natronincola peptidivorans TaxID=426128 RepID=UPI001480D20B|nr:hypothetical protein [Natronincola peptidivorans]
MNKNRIIYIDEYMKTAKAGKTRKIGGHKKKPKPLEEEERQKTFNLFMKVLATMQKESY